MRANVKGGEKAVFFVPRLDRGIIYYNTQLRGKLVFIVRMAFARSNGELFRSYDPKLCMTGF